METQEAKRQEVEAYLSSSEVEKIQTLIYGYLEDSTSLINAEDYESLYQYNTNPLKAIKDMHNVTPPAECATLHKLYIKAAGELGQSAALVADALKYDDELDDVSWMIHEASELLKDYEETADLISTELEQLEND